MFILKQANSNSSGKSLKNVTSVINTGQANRMSAAGRSQPSGDYGTGQETIKELRRVLSGAPHGKKGSTSGISPQYITGP